MMIGAAILRPSTSCYHVSIAQHHDEHSRAQPNILKRRHIGEQRLLIAGAAGIIIVRQCRQLGLGHSLQVKNIDRRVWHFQVFHSNHSYAMRLPV